MHEASQKMGRTIVQTATVVRGGLPLACNVVAIETTEGEDSE